MNQNEIGLKSLAGPPEWLFLYICLGPRKIPRSLSPKKNANKTTEIRLYLPCQHIIYILVHKWKQTSSLFYWIHSFWVGKWRLGYKMPTNDIFVLKIFVQGHSDNLITLLEPKLSPKISSCLGPSVPAVPKKSQSALYTPATPPTTSRNSTSTGKNDLKFHRVTKCESVKVTKWVTINSV